MAETTAAAVSGAFWHYTLTDRLLRIVADARIRRAKAMVSGGERAAVWFSCRSSWEPTATKLYKSAQGEVRRATIPEMITKCGPLVRIEARSSVARYSWVEHRRIGQIDARMADGLERAAREIGAEPNDWRVIYRDVALRDIVSVEASLDGATWERVGHQAEDAIQFTEQFIDLAGWAIKGPE